MTNKRYRKGYLFELRVKQYLEDNGYRVFRLAGSKPADLIAIKRNKVYIVECKAHKKLTKKDVEKILELVDGVQAQPIVAVKDDRKITFMNPKTKKYVRM